MTPDVIARAFDPFLIIKPIGMGTGLGLSMVYGFARRSGGQARPNLKGLFITGYAENAVLSHGHLEPGRHVLIKPFTMDVLASRIKGRWCIIAPGNP